MPIYEYRCGSCGHMLDALQKISDDPLKDCPECDEKALKRLVSAPSFRLKGGGWYETDFKSEKERRRNLADRAGESPAKDTKSESGDKKSDGDRKPEGKKADTGKKNGAGKAATGGSEAA